MRVKRGQVKNRKHKAVLARAKGYRMSYSKLYRRATEALLHAGQYNFAHRRRRHSQMRNSWIKIIAAGLYGTGVSYSTVTGNLKKQNIELDRKVLAEIAQSNPAHFSSLVEQTKA
ncbi:50S ribosomal protein L20 [Candidatus Dojkabacteria bacterium]|uniref:Large ribosomal subunit protein bL20 n=1 Tax=Candidatus Dojkabacteria bacterium TaxID=2099670 RepID=A0A955I906_9BACT|nr:50S ribosomal protein L20 [Candidatus Dojkabacteria bacterium]